MKWLRRGAWVLGTVLGLWAIAWLGVPPLLKWQAEKQLTALLGRTVSVGAVQFRPWKLELQIDQLKIAAVEASAPPTLAVERVRANATLRSLLKFAPVLEAIEIDAPKVHVARTGDGRYDFDDILARLAPKPDAPPPPEQGPARFAVYNFQLRQGEIDFDDLPVKQQHQVKGLTLSLPFISSLPADVDIKVEPRAAFTINGTAFDTGAQTTPFARDRATTLNVRIGSFDLKPYLGYVPASVPVQLRAARINADVAVHLAAPAGQPPTVKVQGSAGLDDLDIADRAGQPLLSWRHLGVGLRDVQPLAQVLALDSVKLEGARLNVVRDAQGRINLQQLAAAPGTGAASGGRPAAAASAASAASATPATTATAEGAPASAATPASAASAVTAAARPQGWNVSVDAFDLDDAAVAWRDATTQPAAELGLDAIRLSAKALHWPTQEMSPLQLDAQLRGSPASVKIEGRAHDKRAELRAVVDKLALASLAPYLAASLKPRLEGLLGASATLEWAADAPAPGVKLKLEQASLDAVRLLLDDAPAKAEPLASLQRLELADVQVDLAGRELNVGSLRLKQPAIDLARSKSGELNVAGWAASPSGSASSPPAPGSASKPPTEQAQPEPAANEPAPWRVKLAEVALDGGRVGWADDAAARPVRVLLDELKLGVQGFEWAGTQTTPQARVTLAARATRLSGPGALKRGATRGNTGLPGRVDWRGQLGLVPLAAKGSLKIDKLPLDAFEPYVAGNVNVDLLRALADFRGDVSVAQSKAGLNASVKGDAQLGDLRIVSRVPPGSLATPDELLTWQALTLKGLSVALAPNAKPKIAIESADLADFYSRLVITEEGRFNLQEVTADGTPKPATGAASAGAAASSPPAAAPVAAPMAGASAPPAPAAELPIELAVGGVTLSNGKVDFSDRFVRPNYSAALSELKGKLGAFRSDTREMATLELRGKAAGTAILDISGSLNPTAKPLALDIRAKATDLELAPLSPYAGKYAGYAIERGKLTMDVAYKIDPDGRLDARNQVVLNQLTFGEKVDSPDATKLPVLFAVSLLKDRHGNIDLDLPISGSINDPQFSVFALVLKVIGNLIVKAVTSPFSLFAGGGSDDLSTVEFRPGSATIVEADATSIDKVAKALLDRPALKMTVTGTADAAGERAAMQRLALDRRLRAELRREAGGNAAAGDDDNAPMKPEDRARALREVYRRADIPDKPRNLIGMVKDVPAAEMETALLARTLVSDESARELAIARGIAVRDALIAKGLPSERLFLAAPKLRAGTEGDAAWTPRVSLALSAN